MKIQGERIVFRSWKVTEELTLMSTAKQEDWSVEMRAQCLVVTDLSVDHIYDDCFDHQVPHKAPGDDCDCGLYGIYSLDNLVSQPYSIGIVGAIAVSGEVLVGPKGVKAERARIVLLSGKDNSPLNKIIAQATARNYGVPYCDFKDLKKLAFEFGQPVEDDLKPKPVTAGHEDRQYQVGGYVRQVGGYVGVRSGVRSTQVSTHTYNVNPAKIKEFEKELERVHKRLNEANNQMRDMTRKNRMLFYRLLQLKKKRGP